MALFRNQNSTQLDDIELDWLNWMAKSMRLGGEGSTESAKWNDWREILALHRAAELRRAELKVVAWRCARGI